MRSNTKKMWLLCLAFISTLPVFAQVVTVDNYYNQETKKDKQGNTIAYHYLWNDTAMTGFSILGSAFTKNGAKQLNTLSTAPTAKNLEGTDVFIIVDPDHVGDNPKPNYMNNAEASVIAEWVKAGGVLFLMGNDEQNADLEHFNLLTSKFGFTFNNDLILHVKDDDHFDDGGLKTDGQPLFKTSKYIFIKNAASINIQHTAKPLLQTADKKNAMVTAK
ncbi:MAG: glycoside hydrolase family 88 protein, partial [Pedobacter sp.]